MQHYDRFVFESFNWDSKSRSIFLRYSLDSRIHFEEVITLPNGLTLAEDNPDLDAALFALHLAGGASYFKTYCPKTIEINSGQLSRDQADYWNHLYTHGLGEFFFRNQLDFRGLINFPFVEKNAPPAVHTQPKIPRKLLVPFGGGKDSIVTTELLKQTGSELTLFRVRRHRLITELAETAELPIIELDRTLAPQLFALNEAGAYNGHVPITAYIAFLAVVVSLLAGFDGLVFSNERSSSYGNVDYLGMAINHQWSKSQTAEEMLASYIGRFVTSKVTYLNIMRPLSELHIAKLFATWPKYFPLATSCNRNWLLSDRDDHASHWCGKCPKCAFTFALLGAWLPEATVTSIFGHNLFNDADLLPLYRKLLGIEGFKPFECVGTPDETSAAFYLAMAKPGFANSLVMTEFVSQLIPHMPDPPALVTDLLTPELELAGRASADLLRKTSAV